VSPYGAQRDDWRTEPHLRGEPTVAEERVARRVVELLTEAPRRKLMNTAEVADWLGIEPATAREMADELGAWRLPSEGGKGRLRFDAAEIEHRLRAQSDGDGEAKPPSRSAPRPRGGSDARLLPIRGTDAK
jgi:hypothetical protein